MSRCSELELLLRALDEAQNTSEPDDRQIAELQRRIREHRELHADCDLQTRNSMTGNLTTGDWRLG
jgi:hypothetical protein